MKKKFSLFFNTLGLMSIGVVLPTTTSVIDKQNTTKSFIEKSLRGFFGVDHGEATNNTWGYSGDISNDYHFWKMTFTNANQLSNNNVYYNHNNYVSKIENNDSYRLGFTKTIWGITEQQHKLSGALWWWHTNYNTFVGSNMNTDSWQDWEKWDKPQTFNYDYSNTYYYKLPLYTHKVIDERDRYSIDIVYFSGIVQEKTINIPLNGTYTTYVYIGQYVGDYTHKYTGDGLKHRNKNATYDQWGGGNDKINIGLKIEITKFDVENNIVEFNLQQGWLTENNARQSLVQGKNGYWFDINSSVNGKGVQDFFDNTEAKIRIIPKVDTSNYENDNTTNQQKLADELDKSLKQTQKIYVNWKDTSLTNGDNKKLIQERINQLIINTLNNSGYTGYLKNNIIRSDIFSHNITTYNNNSTNNFKSIGKVNTKIDYKTRFQLQTLNIETPFEIISKYTTDLSFTSKESNFNIGLYNLWKDNKLSKFINQDKNNMQDFANLFNLENTVFAYTSYEAVKQISIESFDYDTNNKCFIIGFNLDFVDGTKNTAKMYVDDKNFNDFTINGNNQNESVAQTFLNSILDDVNNNLDFYADNNFNDEEKTKIENGNINKNIFERMVFKDNTNIDSWNQTISGIGNIKQTNNIFSNYSGDYNFNFKVDTTNTDDTKSIWIDDNYNLKITFSNWTKNSNGNLDYDLQIEFYKKPKDLISVSQTDNFVNATTSTKTFNKRIKTFSEVSYQNLNQINFFELKQEDLKKYFYFSEFDTKQNTSTDINNLNLEYDENNKSVAVNYSIFNNSFSKSIPINEFFDFNTTINNVIQQGIKEQQVYLTGKLDNANNYDDSGIGWDFLSVDNTRKAYLNIVKKQLESIYDTKNAEFEIKIIKEPVITKATDLSYSNVKMSFEYKLIGRNSLIKNLDGKVLAENTINVDFNVENLIMSVNKKELENQLNNSYKNYNDQILNYENRLSYNKEFEYISVEQVLDIINGQEKNDTKNIDNTQINKNALEKLFNKSFDFQNNFFVNINQVSKDKTFKYDIDYYNYDRNQEILKTNNFYIDLTTWKNAEQILNEYIEDNENQIQNAINTYKTDFLYSFKNKLPKNISINILETTNKTMELQFIETYTKKTVNHTFDFDNKNNNNFDNQIQNEITKNNKMLYIYIGVGIGLLLLIILISVLIDKKRKTSLKYIASKKTKKDDGL